MPFLRLALGFALLLGAGASSAHGGENWSAAGRAKALLDQERPDALTALIGECAELLPDPAAYAEAIKEVCLDIAAHPRVDRRAYQALQDAASSALTRASPETARIGHRIAMCLTRGNAYLRELAPDDWRAIRSRNCQILAAFARRLGDPLDAAFDPAHVPELHLPDGLLLPPDTSGALPRAEAIADPAQRAAYAAELRRYEEATVHHRQQTTLRSVWTSFRKDLVAYLIASHIRHPTDYPQLAEMIVLCGLDQEREAILTAVAEGSQQPIPGWIRRPAHP
jgi:hypothetical protein